MEARTEKDRTVFKALALYRSMVLSGEQESEQSKAAYSAAMQMKDQPSASEALFMFMGWLTTRVEPVTLSRKHDASIAADLVGQFCKANNLPDPRDGWEKLMEHPVTDVLYAAPSEESPN